MGNGQFRVFCFGRKPVKNVFFSISVLEPTPKVAMLVPEPTLKVAMLVQGVALKFAVLVQGPGQILPSSS